MKSIIQSKKECYCCHTTFNLEEHHIFAGAYRNKSEQYGLKVWLCNKHHTGADGVHNGNKWLNKSLKTIAQHRFEQEHPELNFAEIFGRNWDREDK